MEEDVNLLCDYGMKLHTFYTNENEEKLYVKITRFLFKDVTNIIDVTMATDFADTRSAFSSRNT